MVFVTKSGNREGVLQFWDYGYGVNKGGGLYKVSGLKSGRPVIQDILKNSSPGQMARETRQALSPQARV